MTLLVVGASHRSSPLSLLEQVAVVAADPASVEQAVAADPDVDEVMVLATCNRVEVYLDTARFHGGLDAVAAALASGTGVDLDVLGEHMYAHYDGAAVEHLFTVVAGLDSMALGEAQILGQVRDAYGRSRAAGNAAGRLASVVEPALRAGRRARADTGLDRYGNRMVEAALDRAEAVVGPLPGASAAVVGAGGMAGLVAATLSRRGIDQLSVVNRSAARAQRLAEGVGGVVADLADLPALLASHDVILSCTGATGHVISTEAVRSAVALRQGRPLVLVDLGLPRDVDPDAGSIDGVEVVDLAQLGDVLAGTGVPEAELARAVVAEEVAAWQVGREAALVAPTVVALRTQAAEVVAAELQRLRGRLPQVDEAVVAELERTVRRVVDKVLHTPTVRVQELAGGPGGSAYAEALQTLFGLDVGESMAPVGDLRDVPASTGTGTGTGTRSATGTGAGS